VRAAQAWALLADERAVLPEHVQAVLPSVAAHRLERRSGGDDTDGQQRVAELLASVPVPV
jgi:MoxR-like ATPase